ncbi:MAG: HDOD domain-containing protein [Fimbriimonadales bacterium]
MSNLPTYNDLRDAFSQGKGLPKLPGTALELVRIIDSGSCNATDLERVIARDPSLSAGLLRMANSAMFGGLTSVSTIQGAVMRLGYSSVRSMGLSLAVTAMVGGNTKAFDAGRFARHNVFVGFLARYFYARRKALELFKSSWSADEIFSAGILHDLPIALLSRVSPAAYEAVVDYSAKRGISVRTGFQEFFENSLGALGRIAADAWTLPSIFGETMEFVEAPFDHGHETISLACLALADEYANRSDWAFEGWGFRTDIDQRVVELIGLAEEDVTTGIEMVGRHAEAFLADTKQAA